MNAQATVRKNGSVDSLSRILIAGRRLVVAAIACVSTAAFDPVNVNAQEWVPRNAHPTAIIAPVAQTSGATHLIIDSPRPPKHNRSAQPAASQIAMPVYQESIGGGYWNQTDSRPPAIGGHGEMMFDDQFGAAELPTPPPAHQKIDLTRGIPSHLDKTPRSTAIPQASRTSGWKHPYSYGHFGATHNRQWSVHHGHQRSHTQWTFR